MSLKLMTYFIDLVAVKEKSIDARGIYLVLVSITLPHLHPVANITPINVLTFQHRWR